MKVEWTEPATADLDAIRAYIARDSEYYAARFVQEIIKTARMLGAFPELGQVVPEFEERTVRERVLQNYRILYEIRDRRVIIVAIIHAARDMDSITLPKRY
jgi:toxin ParE1/3/4